MLIWLLCLLLVRGTNAQSLSSPFSYTLYIVVPDTLKFSLPLVLYSAPVIRYYQYSENTHRVTHKLYLIYRRSQKSLSTYTTDDKNHLILTINVRKLVQQTGVTYSSPHAVLKKYLHLLPCKITSVHELRERERVKRVEY
jgi:hypothetical protein